MSWWFPVRRCGHKSVVSLMKHRLELLSLAWLPSHPALTVNVVLVWHDAYDTYTMCQHVILLTELVTAHKHTHLNKKRAAVVQFYPPTVCPPELTFNTSTFFCSNDITDTTAGVFSWVAVLLFCSWQNVSKKPGVKYHFSPLQPTKISMNIVFFIAFSLIWQNK